VVALYEDELALAFLDVNPVAPVHFLVIPKDKDGLERLSDCDERHKAVLGHLLWVAQHVARQQGASESGFRIVINDGPDARQSVAHLHLHVLGGRTLSWPPDSQLCAHVAWVCSLAARCFGCRQRCMLKRQASPVFDAAACSGLQRPAPRAQATENHTEHL